MKIRTALLGVCATLSLAGCGQAVSAGSPAATAGPAAPGTSRSAASATRVACSVAPAPLVSSALGVRVGTVQETHTAHTVVCTYTGPQVVILRIQTDQDASGFAAERAMSTNQGVPASDLSGFYDHAYTVTISAAGFTTNTVAALNGTIEVQVSSSASYAAEKAFLSRLFAVL